ncbi:hypothetical protein OO17_18050 [Rhodopseudomonas palustris]|uniref:Uncharacterized protein n=1 Tax=Rhodopseudomonas palustris TaxID=1076 RepID=A0A0D7EHH5_RHOPL|nr:hypothetical protein OO17_18050 [Rhodopseudomonas palustris]
MDIRNVSAVVLIATLLLGSADVASARPWRADEGNTRGWQLMSPQERIDHQARVRGFTDYRSCEVYRRQHHALMVMRAVERRLKPPDSQWDFCEHLKPSPPQRN